MIKLVIFDLDNTLIEWKDEYYDSLDTVLDYYNIKYNKDIKEKIIDSVENYENKHDYYSFDLMKEDIEKAANINIPDDFIFRWTKELEKCYPQDNRKIKELLDYLKDKYELRVLTNWFLDEQVNRLKNYGILEYFTEVIATETNKNKPNKETFIKSINNYDEKECLFVGDSYKKDYLGAINAGLNSILLDKDNKYIEVENRISDLYELKKVL